MLAHGLFEPLVGRATPCQSHPVGPSRKELDKGYCASIDVLSSAWLEAMSSMKQVRKGGRWERWGENKLGGGWEENENERKRGRAREEEKLVHC